MTTLRVRVLNLFVIPEKRAESYHFPTDSEDNYTLQYEKMLYLHRYEVVMTWYSSAIVTI